VFLPWKDENPTRGTSWITLSLLGLNAVTFLGELLAGLPDTLFLRHGMVPARLLGDGGLFTFGGGATLLTSMFLHGSPLHLLSNLLYLWIFGNNIEDALGPVRFLVFYLLCGLGGHAAQIAAHPGSTLPTVGASGAIAGVLAAYLLRFPGARIRTFTYLIFLFGNFRVPAAVVIGFWFLMQLLGGLGELGAAPGGGGVAWFEHLGGFVSGLVLFPAFVRGRRWRSERW